MWRTIIGDVAIATGQDAQTTAESVVGPMDLEAATANFESQVKPSTRHHPLFRSLNLPLISSWISRMQSLVDTLEDQLSVEDGLMRQTADKILRLCRRS